MQLDSLRGVFAALLSAAAITAASAQQASPPTSTPQALVPAEPPAPVGKVADPMAVPSFWDPRRRPERPDLSRIRGIRFLTETDYPPFDYAGPDGTPIGFNVDLARLVCAEIKVPCTVQMRRFDTLVTALNSHEGDAIIASLAETPQMRKQVDFSDPYYRTPARFVAKRDFDLKEITPHALTGLKVAVVAGTAHAAYLKTLFTDANIETYPTPQAARAALEQGKADLLFGDGISLSFWLNGADSATCCKFIGGPYLESRYFGEGVGIAVRRGDGLLRLAFNWALFRLWESGRFTDLWLRYFPISPF